MDVEAYADLLPWLVFVVIDRHYGLDVRWAAGAAGATGLALALWAYWRGRRAPAARSAVVVFAACSAAAGADHWWNSQVAGPRVLSVLALAVVAAISLAFQPLSEAYAAPLVTPAVRESPGFRRLNIELTVAWAIGAAAVSATFAATLFVQSSVAITFFNWVLPLAIGMATILWVARRFEVFTLQGGPSGEDARAGGERTAAAPLPFLERGDRRGEVIPLRRRTSG